MKGLQQSAIVSVIDACTMGAGIAQAAGHQVFCLGTAAATEKLLNRLSLKISDIDLI
jgi:3-hydroxyacyl-CoA dehydrogenase